MATAISAIDWPSVQQRLVKAGYAIGRIDGIAGRQTWAGTLAYVASRPAAALQLLGEAAAAWLPHYGIDASAPRLANFLGQGCHETQGFRYLREIWGPTKAQLGYEGRTDLGNCTIGDGRLFCGRGIFQLTGRSNYREIGELIGQPLEQVPSLAERPDVAMQTAAQFWIRKGLAALADAGREDEITRKINGGTNGIEERRRLVARAKGLLV